MFLHSGASLHGHEYSDRQLASYPQAAAQNLRYPLLWSPFSPAKPCVSATVDGVPANSVLAPASVLRQRPVSAGYFPRTPEMVVRFQEPAEEDAKSVMTEDVLSDSEFSESMLMDGMSAMSRPRRPRRRVPRKHTTFFLGYPTPKLLGRQKVMQKVLPRLLLQLQKVSEDGRSRPILEIFPASRITGPVITPRLAKRFPGIFGVKRQLGYDDLVLVRRDDDDSTSDSTESDEESLGKGKLVAVYSPLKHSDAAEIVLDDGAVWVARPLPNGSYDFVHEDAQGNVTTVRWARRSIPSRLHASPETTTSSVADAPQSRFTFSIINPSSRRHPVLASLNQSSLDVQDTYSSVTSFSGYPRLKPASRTASMTSSSQYMSMENTLPATPGAEPTLKWGTDGESENEALSPLAEPETKRMINTIDDSTKMLISVTALWVALRSGWSPNYTPSHADSSGAATCGGRIRRGTFTRANTSDSCGRLTPQLSESEVSQHGSSKRNSLPAQLPGGLDGPPPSRTPTPVFNARGLPRRATSTGAAFMQRHISQNMSEEMEQNRAHANGKRSNLAPPPASNLDNAHILSPIPSTPAARFDTRALTGDDLFAQYNNSIPRSVSVMETRHRQKKWEESGTGHKKGGMRSRLSRWVHKLGAR